MKAMARDNLDKRYDTFLSDDTIKVRFSDNHQPIVTYRKVRDTWNRVTLYPTTANHYLQHFALIDAYVRSLWTEAFDRSMRYEDDILPLASNGWSLDKYYGILREAVSIKLSRHKGHHTILCVNGRSSRTQHSLKELPLVAVVIDSASISEIYVLVDNQHCRICQPNDRSLGERALAILNSTRNYIVGVYEGGLPDNLRKPHASRLFGHIKNRKPAIVSPENAIIRLNAIWRRTSETFTNPGVIPGVKFSPLIPTAPMFSESKKYEDLIPTGMKAVALYYEDVPYQSSFSAIYRALNQQTLAGIFDRTVEPGLVVHLAWTNDAYNTKEAIVGLANKVAELLAPIIAEHVSSAHPTVYFWPACHFAEAIVASDKDAEPPFSVADCRVQTWWRVDATEKMPDDVIVSIEDTGFASVIERGDQVVRWAPCGEQIPSNPVIKESENRFWRSMPALEFYHYHMVRYIVQDVIKHPEPAISRYLVCDLNASSRRLLTLYTLSFLNAYLTCENPKVFGNEDVPKRKFTRIVLVGPRKEESLLKMMARFYRFSLELSTEKTKLDYQRDITGILETDALLLVDDAINDDALKGCNAAYLIRFTSSTTKDPTSYARITFNGAAVHEDMWKQVQISMKVIHLADPSDENPNCRLNCVKRVIADDIPQTEGRVMLVHSDHLNGAIDNQHFIRTTAEMKKTYKPCTDLVTIQPDKKEMRELYSTLVGPNTLTKRGIRVHALFFADLKCDLVDPITDLIENASYHRNDTSISRGVDLKCDGQTCEELRDIHEASTEGTAASAATSAAAPAAAPAAATAAAAVAPAAAPAAATAAAAAASEAPPAAASDPAISLYAQLKLEYAMADTLTEKQKTQFTDFFTRDGVDKPFRCGNVYAGRSLENYTDVMLDIQDGKNPERTRLVVWLLLREEVIGIMTLRGLLSQSDTSTFVFDPDLDHLMSGHDRQGIGIMSNGANSAFQAFQAQDMSHMVFAMTSTGRVLRNAKPPPLVHLEFICARPAFLNAGISAGKYLLDWLSKQMVQITPTREMPNRQAFILALVAKHVLPSFAQKDDVQAFIEERLDHVQTRLKREPTNAHLKTELDRLLPFVQGAQAIEKWDDVSKAYFEFYGERAQTQFYDDKWKYPTIKGSSGSKDNHLLLITELPFDPVTKPLPLSTIKLPAILQENSGYIVETPRVMEVTQATIEKGFFMNCNSQHFASVLATVTKDIKKFKLALGVRRIVRQRLPPTAPARRQALDLDALLLQLVTISTDFGETPTPIDRLKSEDNLLIGIIARAIKQCDADLPTIVEALKFRNGKLMEQKAEIQSTTQARGARAPAQMPRIQEFVNYVLLKVGFALIRGAAKDLLHAFPFQASELLTGSFATEVIFEPLEIIQLFKVASNATGKFADAWRGGDFASFGPLLESQVIHSE